MISAIKPQPSLRAPSPRLSRHFLWFQMPSQRRQPQPRSPEANLLKLQKEWDIRLKASGFEDAECRRTGMLHTWSGPSTLREDRTTDSPRSVGLRSSERRQTTHTSSTESKRHAAAYYRLASAFRWTHEFPSELDAAVWELHAAGLSYKTISMRTPLTARQIRWKINKFRCIMLGK